jgi:hypothetical protein
LKTDGEYYRQINEKKLNTEEEKRAFFEDKPGLRMTEPDPEILEQILRFIEETAATV